TSDYCEKCGEYKWKKRYDDELKKLKKNNCEDEFQLEYEPVTVSFQNDNEYTLEPSTKMKKLSKNKIDDITNQAFEYYVRENIRDDLDPKIILIFLMITRITYQEILKLNNKKIESRYKDYYKNPRQSNDAWRNIVDGFVKDWDPKKAMNWLSNRY
ncbi:4388_t:CDS:2, partial [Scutellospora calospora]